MSPIEALRHHVTGAIERGEKQAIVEQPAGLPFGRKLAHLITEQDVKDSKRKGYNRYALGIMLGAAHECETEIASGTRAEVAFSDHFTPTRSNHSIAKKLGLALDVVRGRWVSTIGLDASN